MAGPSDKARFYLEHSATELTELERKKIFTREEISSIAKKRSDFEHVINARGSHPADYMRYIEFEKNVDALRRKRIKRLGVKYKGSGQRTIYFLYNRATKKFSGELALWIQYIDFARKDKAYKRLNDIFTAVVRLHPTKPELWILAAEYFMDTQADITNARSYMQRGLRFCKNSEHLWVEYAKLETSYVGKIAGRRKILGLDIDRTKKQSEDVDMDADVIALPQVTAEDINPSLREQDGVDEAALQNLASTPVLTGAIPIAIFDAAMKQFNGSGKTGDKFFTMFAEFDQLACIKRILQHVLDFMDQSCPHTVEMIACRFRMQLFDLHPASAEFPSALREGLELLGDAIEQDPSSAPRLAEVAVRQMLKMLRLSELFEEMDASVQKVLLATVRKYSRMMEDGGQGSGQRMVDLVRSLQQEGKRSEADKLIRLSMKQWGAHEELQKLHGALET